MPAALRPCAWVAPTATAAAFFATPASSTPTGSSDTSHTTPARWNASATRWASASERDAQTRPAPRLDHLQRVRRAAHAGHPLGPERRLEQRGGRRAVRRHEPLGKRHDPGAVRHAEPLELLDGLADPLGGNGEQDQVGAAELVGVGAEGADPEVARKLDARQVALVLARTRQLLGLLGRAAQQRRANAGPLEQHGDGGAEGPGPDDGGAAWMLAGVADGRRS